MIERALEQLRRGPEPIVQIECFTEADGELEAIALFHPSRIHRAQRFARGGEFGRVGIPPEPLQMHASQHQPRAIRHRRLLQRFERGLLGEVVLTGVVESTGLGQGIGSCQGARRQHEDGAAARGAVAWGDGSTAARST